MGPFARICSPGAHSLGLALLAVACHAAELNSQTARCNAIGSNPFQSDPAYLRRLAGSTDSQYVAQRSRIGMPQSDSVNVKNVVVEAVCTKMVKSIDSVQSRVDAARKVYLYKFANGWYAAVDPNSTTLLGVIVWYFYNGNSKYKGAFSLGGS